MVTFHNEVVVFLNNERRECLFGVLIKEELTSSLKVQSNFLAGLRRRIERTLLQFYFS